MRPKRGFGVPLRRWFQEQMIGWARDILLDPRTRAARLDATRSEVRALLQQHESGSRDHAKRIWALVCLELWARAHVDRRAGRREQRMRVTMLVRCLAMMRGGGETRHLAWARELTALGVDVEIITGAPLLRRRALSGRRRRRRRVLRSPYARDFVYRWQNRRGFGRLTMTALHARRRMVLPRGVAAHRGDAAPSPTSCTRTRCIRRRGCGPATCRS